MIHLASSLIKSGSGWYVQMANHLHVRAGHSDARDVRERYGLDGVLRYENCLLHPTARKLWRLAPAMHERFAVKSHSRPRAALVACVLAGKVRVSYIYRDPRDVVVSALDHGRRFREKEPGNRAAKLYTVEDSAALVANLLRWGWAGWWASRLALMVRYEDVVADPRAELRRLAEYLRLDVSDEDVDASVRAFEPAQASAAALDAMKYNTARAGRWRDELTPAEVAACHAAFGRYLGPMGYE